MVQLSMPRIETDTDQDLNEIMASLGMPNAFQDFNGHGFLNFCYFGDNEDDSDQCFISLMRQKAHLKLDEKGTEAAAATVIGMADNAAPAQYAEFIADRPFLYIISERSTGIIFFIGQYMGDITMDMPQVENNKHTTASPAIYDLQGRKVSVDQSSILKRGIYIVDGKKVIIK